jgi:DNA-binding MarR family transcriptional regulator
MGSKLPERQNAVNMKRPAQPRTGAGDALSALAVQVFQLNGLLLKAGDALTRPAGQTSARWQVLAAAESGTLTVAQTARVLSLTRQSVQRVADLLVEDGLIESRPNPAHARAGILALTSAGLAVLRTIQAAQTAWADALGAQVGEEELRRAGRGLARLLAALRRPA